MQIRAIFKIPSAPWNGDDCYPSSIVIFCHLISNTSSFCQIWWYYYPKIYLWSIGVCFIVIFNSKEKDKVINVVDSYSLRLDIFNHENSRLAFLIFDWKHGWWIYRRYIDNRLGVVKCPHKMARLEFIQLSRLIYLD